MADESVRGLTVGVARNADGPGSDATRAHEGECARVGRFEWQWRMR